MFQLVKHLFHLTIYTVCSPSTFRENTLAGVAQKIGLLSLLNFKNLQVPQAMQIKSRPFLEFQGRLDECQ